MADETTFGTRLAEMRRSAGLTQEELGAVACVGKGAVSSWEVGRTQPTLEQLAAISERLSVSTDYLLRGERRKKRGDDLRTPTYAGADRREAGH